MAEVSRINFGDGINRDIRDNKAVAWTAAETSVKKNLLRNTASTQTVNGVTFTVNSDGTVTVSTGAGGATDRADLKFLNNEAFSPASGNYILNGCPSGGGSGVYRIQFWNNTKSSGVDDIGEGVEFSADHGDIVTCQITVYSGQIITTPIVFKPMIRLASITDSTYAPYIMDNVELAAEVATKASASSVNAKTNLSVVASAYDSETYYHKGDYVTYNGSLYRCIIGNNSVIVNTDPTNTGSWAEIKITDDLYALNKYFQQTDTLSTSATTTFTFTSTLITTSSMIDVACSEWGLVPDSVTVSTGSCTVVMPQVDSAISVTVRIYVR